jgi:hypothetical protein
MLALMQKNMLFCIFCIMSANCPPQKTLGPLIGRQSDEASPESPDINPITSHCIAPSGSMKINGKDMYLNA